MIFIVGFYYLIKNVNYAFMDTASLLCYAKNLRNFIFTDITLTTILSDNIYEIRPNQNYFSYNPYLNIIKLFPDKYLLRWSQFFNLFLFIAFLIGMYIVQFNILKSHFSNDSNFSDIQLCLIICPFIFTLLVGIRTKVMLVVVLALSDVLNYFLFILSVLVALYISYYEESLITTTVCLGIINGFAFRNRHQDIILFLTGLFYLIYLKISFVMIALYSIVFFITNIDCFYFEILSKNKSYKKNSNLLYYLRSLGPLAGYYNKKDNGEYKNCSNIYSAKARLYSYVKILWNFISYIAYGLKQMVNFYSSESLWISLGSIMLITPFSLYVLIRNSLFSDIFVYLGFYTLGLLFIFLFMRHRYISGDKKLEHLFFGGRWLYILFAVFAVVNGISFCLICSNMILFNDNLFYFILFVIFLCCYFGHQIYRLADYYLSEFIYETNLITIDKQPDFWRVEFAEFLSSLRKPVTIMGNHLIYGIAHNFYQWGKDMECVDVYHTLSDDDIARAVEKYKVNYIVLTPGTPLVNINSTLGKDRLSSKLALILNKITTRSPNITIYKVSDAT